MTEISREIRVVACNIFQQSKVCQNLAASAVIPFIDIYAGALLYITVCSLEFSAPDSEVEGWLDSIFLKHKEPFLDKFDKYLVAKIYSLIKRHLQQGQNRSSIIAKLGLDGGNYEKTSRVRYNRLQNYLESFDNLTVQEKQEPKVETDLHFLHYITLKSSKILF